MKEWKTVCYAITRLSGWWKGIVSGNLAPRSNLAFPVPLSGLLLPSSERQAIWKHSIPKTFVF